MTDIVDAATRSRMMATIRGKDTGPELALRRALHARGCRYRLHVKDLPGKPDIVLPKHRAVIFVHGCFWHRHPGCRYATTPATRTAFWATKFEANVCRDRRDETALRAAGWRVAVVWDCALRRAEHVAHAAEEVTAWLRSDTARLELGQADVLRRSTRGGA